MSEEEMAKRFIDTSLYSGEWFCSLSPTMKCMWVYLLVECDHAGVWNSNLRLASFKIGAEITRESFDDTFGSRIRWVDEDKVFVPAFITHQYGSIDELDECNSAHRGVLRVLRKYGIVSPSEAPPKDLGSPYQGAQDKDKDTSSSSRASKVEIGALPEFGSGLIVGELLSSVPHSVQRGWLEAYPDVEWVKAEILSAGNWLIENPKKQKKSLSRFLGNWLRRGWASRKAPTTTAPQKKPLVCDL